MTNPAMHEPRKSGALRGGPLALTLGGGGARGAYQAGVLRGLASRCPSLRFQILTGISAGAVNTIHLASGNPDLVVSADQLCDLWLRLTPGQVFDVRSATLMLNAFRWGARLLSGGIGTGGEPMKGMVDTQPLREFLTRSLEPRPDGSIEGIARNLDSGALRAVALTATSYSTGLSVTWVQSKEAELWLRPQRRSEYAALTVEHVMASSALPMLFPAVQVHREWYGDGGMRLTAPLSPALHLGASRILTISTKYQRSSNEPGSPMTAGYPPPAQVLGSLYNAVFLDLIDEDIVRLGRINHLLDNIPRDRREGLRKVEIMVIRPSQDLGRLAAEFEPKLPGLLRYLTRGLGTAATASPDILSFVLFQHDYIKRLIEIGEADGAAHAGELETFAAPA